MKHLWPNKQERAPGNQKFTMAKGLRSKSQAAWSDPEMEGRQQGKAGTKLKLFQSSIWKLPSQGSSTWHSRSHVPTCICPSARCSAAVGGISWKLMSSLAVVLNLVKVMELFEHLLKSLCLSPGKFNASQSAGYHFTGFLILCFSPSST